MKCSICKKPKNLDDLTIWENVDTGEKHCLCEECNAEWESQLAEYKHTDWVKTK